MIAKATVAGGADAFVGLIEGGAEGEFYSDMKDYFYYSQIRSKGEQTTQSRTLDGKIPLEEVGGVMCALGYYPTQKEIDNMINEIKANDENKTAIGFDEFVKLYVNHRPVFSTEPEQVEEAFEALAKKEGSNIVSRNALLHYLTAAGEKMKVREIEECFQALVGCPPTEVLEDTIEPQLFTADILGLAGEEEEQ